MADQPPVEFRIQFRTKGVAGDLSDLKIVMTQVAGEVFHEGVNHLYMVAPHTYLVGEKLGRNNLFERFYFPRLRETHASQSRQEQRQILPLGTRSLVPFQQQFERTNRPLTWETFEASLVRITVSSEVETANSSVKPLHRQ